jgi:hypothetical protein
MIPLQNAVTREVSFVQGLDQEKKGHLHKRTTAEAIFFKVLPLSNATELNTERQKQDLVSILTEWTMDSALNVH